MKERTRESNREFLRKVHKRSPEKKFGFFEQLQLFDGRNSYELCRDECSKGVASSILDFGCGDGVFVRYLPDSLIKNSYTGVDISQESLARAVERWGLRESQLVHCDGTTLPFPDNEFDVVCAHMVLALVDDASQCIREIHRVLKSSGRMIVFTPAYWRNSENGESRKFFELLNLFPKFILGDSAIVKKDNPFRTDDGIRMAIHNAFGSGLEVRFQQADFIINFRPLDALSIFTEGFYEFEKIEDSRKPEAAAAFLEKLISLADHEGIVNLARPMELITAVKGG